MKCKMSCKGRSSVGIDDVSKCSSDETPLRDTKRTPTVTSHDHWPFTILDELDDSGPETDIVFEEYIYLFEQNNRLAK